MPTRYGNLVTDGNALAGEFEAKRADGFRAKGVILPEYEEIVIAIPANAALADGAMYTARRAVRVIRIDEVHATTGTDTGAVTLDVKKQTGTQDPTQGVSVLSSTFNLKATANTVVSKTAGAGLTVTAADRELAAGNRLSFDFTGVLTAVAGLQVTMTIQMI